MPKLLRTLERLDTRLETKGQNPQPQLPSPSSIQETLEIHPGSGVYVPKNVWWSACHANSPTTMARVLLLGVFNTETLLKSNLRLLTSLIWGAWDEERGVAKMERRVMGV
ncbi:hypothetical protein AOLI_G00200410 [Acnodon oligacanthus]